MRRETDESIEAKLAKLPAWARDHIANVERQRDEAIRRYREFLDDQPESPFYCDHIEPGAGMSERRIITHRVGCRVGNVEVEIQPFNDTAGGVQVWLNHKSGGCGRIAVMPESNNVIRIIEVQDGRVTG